MHRGFIVFRGHIGHHYVFRSYYDAERWRNNAGYEYHEIREVASLQPYRWHMSRGTLRDVALADTTYEIFLDHRYEPCVNRAYLLPKAE